jgi:hypothetical protein
MNENETLSPVKIVTGQFEMENELNKQKQIKGRLRQCKQNKP